VHRSSGTTTLGWLNCANLAFQIKVVVPGDPLTKARMLAAYRDSLICGHGGMARTTEALRLLLSSDLRQCSRRQQKSWGGAPPEMPRRKKPPIICVGSVDHQTG